jgi:hypothetical protein
MVSTAFTTSYPYEVTSTAVPVGGSSREDQLINLRCVDFVGRQETIKELLTLPYHDNEATFALHRMDNTLFIEHVPSSFEAAENMSASAFSSQSNSVSNLLANVISDFEASPYSFDTALALLEDQPPTSNDRVRDVAGSPSGVLEEVKLPLTSQEPIPPPSLKTGNDSFGGPEDSAAPKFGRTAEGFNLLSTSR